MPKVIQF
jgi:MoxR-like ATPase